MPQESPKQLTPTVLPLFMPSDRTNDYVPPKSWLRRNWLWFLPVGCLSSLLLFAGTIALIAHLVFSTLKQSDPYQTALASAQASPELAAKIGSPVEASYFATGSIHLENSDGDASLAIPVSGPEGGAIIYVEATKSSGEWTYEYLSAELNDTRERIALDPSRGE
ncbi:cytochrome c oxidase assembly factor Coa1 family protein [Pelagicoccus sp. SDUM812003]|uniref:cytochrome c oxidase assembly factor Coa1 family protein n=1 Tax=Pelagicoccus sp. SDUM812003 TaxID=3041267 RepID=UPI00280E8E4F|nr:cytochrome c oxidase assembly factor Coa1 family protein [Pelagicoccus sp. SDUM812003]MDQ8201728.1 cytochrome c oxidase assembly factor Coa1 family protein [Pelagicoccus sp. SDUM812003]